MKNKDIERKIQQMAMYDRLQKVLAYDADIMGLFILFHKKIKQNIREQEREEVNVST